VSRQYETNDGTFSVSHGLPNQGAYEEIVQAVTVDDYARQQHLSHVDLMKIDCEGSELSIIEGAQKNTGRYCASHFVVGCGG
jgi:FkbM family methyltransferase